MRTFFAGLALMLVLDRSQAQVTVLVNDFPVSDITNVSVYRPALAVAPNGSYAVTWGDSRLGTSNRSGGEGNIYGVIVGTGGSPLTVNCKIDNIAFISSYADFSLFFSSPLFLPSGQLVVVWHVHGVSIVYGIQSDDVYYSAFSGSGQRLGSDVQLNRAGNTTGGAATRPSVAFRPPSTFLAVYEYYKDGAKIGGTIIDINSGAQLGDAFVLSDNAFNNRIYPHVASNGNYTVCVWTDARTDKQTGDVYAERIVGNTLAAANVKVNDDPPGGYNQYARVAMDSQGNYVVVWIDTRSNATGDLYGQRFDAQGNRIGANFKITKSNSQLQEYPPGISMKGDGSFVVTWADSVRQPGNNWGIKTRFFGSSGQPLSDVITVTSAPSIQPDVKIGPTGAVYYTWLDGRENINTGRIYSKIYTGFPTTGIEDRGVPLAFRLDQNYPNPFNPMTAISYQVPANSFVRLNVYDLLGREVATLVSEELSAGQYTRRWNAEGLPSGVYLYHLQARPISGGEAGSVTETKKLILLR